MDKVGVEIIKTEETKESGIKYLNINVSNSEVERNPDIVRLCADAGILEYVKPKTGQMAIKALEQEPKTGHWIANAPQYDMLNPQYICSECGNAHTRTTPYCEMCGAKMVESQESEE